MSLTRSSSFALNVSYMYNFTELAAIMVLFLSCPILECTHVGDNMENVPSGDAPVEVAAVLLNCDLDSIKDHPDSRASRFEREQLYKHNALQDCNKKLAITVKMSNEASTEDSYVPIDHVLDGSSTKRVRLLDPYVLRLRRDVPLQAYKLRLIDTVSGILTSSDKYKPEVQEFGKPSKRNERDTASSQYYEEWSERGAAVAAPARRVPARRTLLRAAAAGYNHDVVQDCGQNETSFNHVPKRLKRQHEQNIIIEEELDDIKKNIAKDGKNMESDQKHEIFVRSTVQSSINDDSPKSQYQGNMKDKREHALTPGTSIQTSHNDNSVIINEQEITKVQEENERIYTDESPTTNQRLIDKADNADEEAEKEFALYEIGNPDLWFKVHLQIYEKLTSDKGTTLWNDITKGQLVSVSSMFPEWSSPDVNVQYRPADFVAREEFTLPITSLCLLVPLMGTNFGIPPKNYNSARPDIDDSYIIVVPAEDILNFDKAGKVRQNLLNISEEKTKTRRRRVVVQVGRALWNVMEDNPDVATHNSEKYLTLLHRKPHRAQVELEVRADENQLVRVGSSGRVAIVVADSTRRARSTVAVQATNTGLAAARFRAQINECDSGLLNLVREKHKIGIAAGPILLPPRHTERLLLEIPVELPTDVQHCSVNLVNDNDESVAVREVVIRRGDRCFCVWHCDCVCYGENPKLPCQEMSEARQDAAGFLKGAIGLVIPCLGSCGLDRVLEAPRRIDHYYEKELWERKVQYDSNGWPVHPDTKKKTVRVISKPMEFLLNVLFFVVAPGLIILDLLRQVTRRKPAGGSDVTHAETNNTKKIYSSHDLQKRDQRARRRRKGLHKWMTPQAEELSAKVWHKDLSVGMSHCEYMLPLLHDGRSGAGAASGPHSSASDSEQEDTAFVLMHMQKSTESLARSQKKPYASGTSSAGHQMKYPTPCRPSQPDSVVRKHY
ncbi:uncharacterized protein isoform X3 [Choristoneura fumiferana]|uniref:uncharacterized protein isoform X3 n=1 Tax=Choristoneura fumiferana TaxID=7141 RepID=UPI003D15AD72